MMNIFHEAILKVLTGHDLYVYEIAIKRIIRKTPVTARPDARLSNITTPMKI